MHLLIEYNAVRARPLHAVEYQCYASVTAVVIVAFFSRNSLQCGTLPRARGLVSPRTQDAHPLPYVGIIQLNQRRGRHVYPSADARRQLSLHPGAFRCHAGAQWGGPLEEYWRLSASTCMMYYAVVHDSESKSAHSTTPRTL